VTSVEDLKAVVFATLEPHFKRERLLSSFCLPACRGTDVLFLVDHCALFFLERRDAVFCFCSRCSVP